MCYAATRGSLEMQNAINRHFGTIAQLCRAISLELRHISTIGKNLLNSNTSSACPRNMVNFGLLTAEIFWRVWGTPANFNGFRILAALLHGILVVGVSKTLRRWTESATYIWQGGHHVGNWPTFLVAIYHLWWYSQRITPNEGIKVRISPVARSYSGIDLVCNCRQGRGWSGTQ